MAERLGGKVEAAIAAAVLVVVVVIFVKYYDPNTSPTDSTANGKPPAASRPVQ
jgi:hypothetical protein